MLFTMHCLFLSKVNYRKFSCEMWWNIENNIFFWSVFVVLTSYHWVQSVRCEKCLRKWPRNKQQFLHGREHFIILVPWAHRLISSSFYEKLYLYADISGTWHRVFSINLLVCLGKFGPSFVGETEWYLLCHAGRWGVFGFGFKDLNKI